MLFRVDNADSNNFPGRVNNSRSSVLGDSGNEELYNLYSRLLSGLNSRSDDGAETAGSGGGNASNENSGILGFLGGILSGIGDAIGRALFNAGEFLSQLRGPANTNEDVSDDNANCGPTATAMVLGDFGIEETNAFGADGEIDHVRRDDMNAGTNEFESTSTRQIARALSKHGLNTKEYHGGATINDIDRELENGNELIVNVNTIAGGWGNAERHFVVVVGKDESGNYVIKDPLQNGPSSVSEGQMKAAMDNRGGYMVAAGNGKGGSARNDNQTTNSGGWDFAKMNKVEDWFSYFGLS